MALFKSSSKLFFTYTLLFISIVVIFFILQACGEETLATVRNYVPPCFFFKFTGIKCLACGGGRAMFSCLHGNYLDAIHYNFWWIAASLTLLVEYVHSFLIMIHGEKISNWWLTGRRWYLSGFAVFSVVFLIARNIWDF